MKCQTCGHELGEGRVFCSRCGSELQMVPDYNLIEDELVVPFVEDKKGHAKGKNQASDDKNVSKLQITKKQLLIIVLVILIFILAIVGITCMYQLNKAKKNGSYSYQKANEYRAAGDIRQAVDYYLDAERKGYSIDGLEETITNLLISVDRFEEAKIRLLNQLQETPNDVELEKQLVLVYLELEDLDSVVEMAKANSNPELVDFYSEYLVEEPVFGAIPEEARPGDIIYIDGKDNEVYYTLDGSSPIENGVLYEGQIELPEGMYEVQAVCKNELGIYGDMNKISLTVDNIFDLPMPELEPRSGEYVVPEVITIKTSAEANAYYTWDGSIPTVSSARYKGGIDMIEGNNVLTVILIDEYGNQSKVQRANYIYMPEIEEEIDPFDEIEDVNVSGALGSYE